jgi:hypothetical protein
MILGDLVLYKDKIINLEIGRNIMVNFNILLLSQDEAVLGMI